MHVYRLQARGPEALCKWLLDLTDSLVLGDPTLSGFGAELLAEARAFSEAKARAGKMGAEAKASSAKQSHSRAKRSRGGAKHAPSGPIAEPSQSDRQTDQGRRSDPVQGEGSGSQGGNSTRGAA